MDPNSSDDALPEGELPPVSVPDHELLRCIGQGSYGQVWLARNRLGLYRAVKVVYRRSFERKEPFEREWAGIRQFEPISRSHEGFVDILQVGLNEERGYFYYVMELGDDRETGQAVAPESYSPKTLGRELARLGRLPLAECLRLGLALSQALGELHRHGLVHRDVKPANIIFVHGVPKLADIGLVAPVREAASFVGTEGFIPPEGPGKPQADVYSLGKVLYEISTGKDRQEFPVLPTMVDQQPEAEGLMELNEVILQACKADPAARYRSAWEMHAHLLVLANGKSVRRLRALEQRLANTKRLASVFGVVALALATILYLVFSEWRRVEDGRQREIGSNKTEGNGYLRAGDLAGALPYFVEVLRADAGSANQEAIDRLRVGSVLAQCPKLTHFWNEEGAVFDAAFSPDGRKLLVAPDTKSVRIHDLETGSTILVPIGHRSNHSAVTFSPDGRLVVTSGEDYTVNLWDLSSQRLLCSWPHSNWVFSVRFSPDGLRLLTSCRDKAARVWNVQTHRLELMLSHTGSVDYAEFSHDGRLIVTASEDNTAALWDATDGHHIETITHKTWVNYATFSPDDKLLVTACFDKKARVFEIGKPSRQIRSDLNHGAGVNTAVFSPDGRLIVTSSWDGTARLWSAETMEPMNPNPILHIGRVAESAGFSPDGRRVVTTGGDGMVRIWDLAGSAMSAQPMAATFSPDGRRFFTISNHWIQVHEAVSGSKLARVQDAVPELESAQFNRNGSFLLGVSVTQTNDVGTNRLLQVWESTTGNRVGPGLVLSNQLAGVTLSEDGRHIVTFGGRAAQVWDLPSGKAAPPLVHEADVSLAEFSPDGTRVATASANLVQVWDAASGQFRFALPKQFTSVSHLAFSAEGARLSTCCSDYTENPCYARIWDAATGVPVTAELRHNDGVLSAVFNRDGHRLLTASEDFTAALWDGTTGKLLTRLVGHEDQVHSAVFSAEAQLALTSSSDGSARIWSAETGDPLAPPFRQYSKLASAQFLPGNMRIVSIDRMGKAFLWDLHVDTKPVGDLRKLARLLAGGAVTPPSAEGFEQTETVQAVWESLRAKYPEQFHVTDTEIDAWHEFLADESTATKDWPAVVTHLSSLVSRYPGEQVWMDRLAKAKANADLQMPPVPTR